MNGNHKLKNLGGSHYFHIPYEYVKVFNLNEKLYKLDVSNDGDMIVFKKITEEEKNEKENTKEIETE